MLTPSARDKIRPALEHLYDTSAAIDLCLTGGGLCLTGESGLNRPAIEARAVMLPLRSDLGDVSRILGAFISDGSIGRTPRRFDVDVGTVRPLTEMARS
ncbi:MAG: hypothetical protein GDA40_09380 [Rhodobacteraceae bacterium]|nr:hypothetical protein [Paracoccaceae bacterium]